MSEPTEREPSPIGDVFLPLFDRCPPQEHPMLLGILERVAAGHYRGWAGLARDEATRRGMLECAKREERIADTLESLEPQAERLVRQVNERFPDLKALYDSVMEGKTLAEQWTIQAIGELGGADVLRNFAEQESDAGKQGVLEGLIPLEEENSAFMRLAATAAGQQLTGSGGGPLEVDSGLRPILEKKLREFLQSCRREREQNLSNGSRSPQWRQRVDAWQPLSER